MLLKSDSELSWKSHEYHQMIRRIKIKYDTSWLQFARSCFCFCFVRKSLQYQTGGLWFFDVFEQIRFYYNVLETKLLRPEVSAAFLHARTWNLLLLLCPFPLLSLFAWVGWGERKRGEEGLYRGKERRWLRQSRLLTLLLFSVSF